MVKPGDIVRRLSDGVSRYTLWIKKGTIALVLKTGETFNISGYEGSAYAHDQGWSEDQFEVIGTCTDLEKVLYGFES